MLENALTAPKGKGMGMGTIKEVEDRKQWTGPPAEYVAGDE